MTGQFSYCIEPEMNHRQQLAIDTYFEEDHFLSAIDALDQFRSPSYSPSAAHMRQLLYIAIQPQVRSSSSGIKDLDFLQSPSKRSPSKAAKHMKSQFLIPPAAVAAAQRLLLSLATINSPAALFRGFPSHTRRDTPINQDADCTIANLANEICRAKDCWEVIGHAFLKRKPVEVTSSPRRKRRRQQHEDESIPSLLESDGVPAIVSEYAWPVLEFYVRVFEIDEEKMDSDSEVKHSSLLLSQLPTPPGDDVLRTDFNTVLAIICYCWRQNQSSRRFLGIRLIILLIHLSMTKYVDAQALISSSFVHLSSFSSDELSVIFTELPHSEEVARYKFAVCQRYIDRKVAVSTSRRKPQARARRLGDTPQQANVLASRVDSQVQPIESSSKRFPIATTDLVRLLESDTSVMEDQALHLTLKYEILVACHRIHSYLPERSEEWTAFLKEGHWKKAFELAMQGSNDPGQKYETAFEAMISVS